MTTLALAPLLATAAKKSSSSSFYLLIFIAAAFLLFYFFVMKPQQRKAQAARAGQGSDIEVGDEVQTIGGVIGTVLEIHGDRYTLLTGALSSDGNLDGPQPTRIVFVRQAIAKKIDRIDDAPVVEEDDDTADDVDASDGASTQNGHGGRGAGAGDEQPEEAEEA